MPKYWMSLYLLMRTDVHILVNSNNCVVTYTVCDISCFNFDCVWCMHTVLWLGDNGMTVTWDDSNLAWLNKVCFPQPCILSVHCIYYIEFEFEHQVVVLVNIVRARKRSGRHSLSLLYLHHRPWLHKASDTVVRVSHSEINELLKWILTSKKILNE